MSNQSRTTERSKVHACRRSGEYAAITLVRDRSPALFRAQTPDNRKACAHIRMPARLSVLGPTYFDISRYIDGAETRVPVVVPRLRVYG